MCVCLCLHAVSTEGLCLVSFGCKIEGVDRGCCCEWDTYALGGKNEKIEEKKSQTTHCLFQLIVNSCAVICKKKSQKLIVRSTRVEIY